MPYRLRHEQMPRRLSDGAQDGEVADAGDAQGLGEARAIAAEAIA